jgi:hypothetical protein
MGKCGVSKGGCGIKNLVSRIGFALPPDKTCSNILVWLDDSPLPALAALALQ